MNKKTRTSKVGEISKAQKAQNIFFRKNFEIYEKNFFRSKKSHSAKKCKMGDPSGFGNMQSVAKYQKIQSRDPFGTSGFVCYVKK